MTLANVKNRCRICFTILKDPNNGKLSDYYSIHTLRRITVTGGYVADLISYNDLLQKFMPFVEHQQSPLHPSDGDDGHHIADHDNNRISSAPPLHSDIVCLNCSEMLSKMFTFHSIFQRLLITLKEKYRRTLRIVNNWAGCHNQQQQHAIDESSGLPVLAAPKKRRCSSNGTNAVDNRTNNPSNNNNNPSENDIETGHASTRSCGPSSRRKGEPRHHLPTSSNATYPTNQSRNSPIASSKKRFRSACADNNEFARIKLLDEIGFNGAVDELAFEFNHHHHQRRQFDSFADEGDSRTAKANNLNRIAASLMVDRNAVDRDDTTSSATNLSEPVPIIHQQQQQNNRSKSNKRRSPLISNRSPSSNHRGMTIASLVQSPPPSSSNPFIMSSPLNVSTNAAIASTSSNNMDVPTSAAIVAIEERLNQSQYRLSTAGTHGGTSFGTAGNCFNGAVSMAAAAAAAASPLHLLPYLTTAASSSFASGDYYTAAARILNGTSGAGPTLCTENDSTNTYSSLVNPTMAAVFHQQRQMALLQQQQQQTTNPNTADHLHDNSNGTTNRSSSSTTKKCASSTTPKQPRSSPMLVNLASQTTTTKSAGSTTPTSSMPNQTPPAETARLMKRKRECPVCAKDVNVNYLKIHLRRHFNHKPFTCKYCPKAFADSGDLQKHIRIHEEDKPYLCPICASAYTDCSNWNTHLRTHANSDNICSICHVKFDNFSAWLAHIREHGKKNMSHHAASKAAAAAAAAAAASSSSVSAAGGALSGGIVKTTSAVATAGGGSGVVGGGGVGGGNDLGDMEAATTTS